MRESRCADAGWRTPGHTLAVFGQVETMARHLYRRRRPEKAVAAHAAHIGYYILYPDPAETTQAASAKTHIIYMAAQAADAAQYL